MSATRPRILVPGLLPRDPARETYRVQPGASTTVELRPDDRLTVRDVHGGQAALLDPSEPSALSLHGPADLFGPTSPAGDVGPNRSAGPWSESADGSDGSSRAAWPPWTSRTVSRSSGRSSTVVLAPGCTR